MYIHQLGLQPYEPIWERMKQFTTLRQSNTPDELWMLEHLPVYTLGQAGKREHIHNAADIPVVQSDRGGQVTYHGPGQLIAYVLMDLRRKNMGVRTLVCQLEQLLITLLNGYHIDAHRQASAPGVYVAGQKIASIGLRVKMGCTYHGIALNVDLNLDPFLGINPCGYQHLKMTQIKDYDPKITLAQVNHDFVRQFSNLFELNELS